MDALYLDCFSGAAGDMLVAALLDLGAVAGAPRGERLEPRSERKQDLGQEPLLDLLREDLGRLALGGFRIEARRDWRGGVAGTRFEVHAEGAAPRRNWTDIQALLGKSDLPTGVIEDATRVFRRLGEAEARVHGCDLEEVHFHEVGAIDSIVDVVSFCALWHRIGRPRILCSPVSVGEGFVETEHGRIPVPAMATLELLRGVPLEMSGIREELVTPTGAALLSTLAEGFGRHWSFTPQRIGYGLGSRTRSDPPNAIRAVHCSLEGAHRERVTVLEVNLDDATGQELAHLLDRCLEAGALDVTLHPVTMKKGRPGSVVQVLAPLGCEEELAALLLAEGPTLGVRWHAMNRRVLEREVGSRDTSLGPVRVKTSILPDGSRRSLPEFDDLQELSRRHQRPLREVRRQVQRDLEDGEAGSAAAG